MPFGGLINLVGQGIGALADRMQQKRSNEYNQKMWHMENAYNDPSAQMDRLKKAGLNPNLVYGGSPGQVAGTAGNLQPQLPIKNKFQMPNPLDYQMQQSQIKNTKAQTDNLGYQSEVILQDALLKAAQTREAISRTLGKDIQNNVAFRIADYNVDAAFEGVQKLRHENSQNVIKTNILGQQYNQNEKVMPVELEKLQNEVKVLKATESGITLSNHLKNMENQLAELGIYPNSPWYIKILGRQGINLSKLPIIKKYTNQ